MNILFYTAFEVSPEKGGTERITASVAETLQRDFGHKCFSMYSVPIDPKFRRAPFYARYKLGDSRVKKNRYDLHRFIKEKNIDVIINQGAFEFCKTLKEITADLPNVRIILCHHFQPGWEEHFGRIKSIVHKPKDFIDCLRICWRLSKYPYQKLTKVRRNKEQYRIGYQYADRVVLLSTNFIPEFLEYAGIYDKNKFMVVHNVLSFDAFFDIKQYTKKRKEVLIVSRLDETQKRLSLAIRIWAFIEADHELDDWTLKIVGHGVDEQMYRKLAASLHLKRLSFEGAQQSQPYYEQASIFMMTSKSEGWGLTLTEAQQMGCVPIAFDTYASLHDILTDGENGLIITEGDLSMYFNKMKQLMLNGNMRKDMAARAIESSHRFDQPTIGKQWNMFFNNVDTNELSTNVKGGGTRTFNFNYCTCLQGREIFAALHRQSVTTNL